MTKPITPEMIAAWRTLQAYAEKLPRYVNPTTEETALADAIRILDNSDYMAPIQDAGECGDISAALPEPPCDLDKPCPVHDAAPLDPAEWGDTTREDIARRQQEQDAAIIAAGGEVRMTSIPLSQLTGEGLSRALRKGRGKSR